MFLWSSSLMTSVLKKKKKTYSSPGWKRHKTPINPEMARVCPEGTPALRISSASICHAIVAWQIKRLHGSLLKSPLRKIWHKLKLLSIHLIFFKKNYKVDVLYIKSMLYAKVCVRVCVLPVLSSVKVNKQVGKILFLKVSLWAKPSWNFAHCENTVWLICIPNADFLHQWHDQLRPLKFQRNSDTLTRRWILSMAKR